MKLSFCCRNSFSLILEHWIHSLALIVSTAIAKVDSSSEGVLKAGDFESSEGPTNYPPTLRLNSDLIQNLLVFLFTARSLTFYKT